MNPIRFAIPKGSLEKKTRAFLERAGIDPQGYADGSRNYRPDLGVEGVETKMMRPQEIPYLLQAGFFDLGISGVDWYYESEATGNVEDLLDLGFGRVDIVLCVSSEWRDVRSASDLFARFVDSTGTQPLRIWTEYLNLTESLIRQHTDLEPALYSPYTRLSVRRSGASPIAIFHSFGATESKPPEDGEAIVDNTETGTTLRANGLKIIHKVLEGSTAHLLANRRAMRNRDKREAIARVRDMMAVAAPAPIEEELVFGHI